MSCTVVYRAVVSHRTMSCTAVSHSHVLHSGGPHRTDLHSNVAPSGALHNSDPHSCELHSRHPHSGDPHRCPRASPSIPHSQPSEWGWPGATGRGLLAQALSHFREHPTQPGTFGCVMVFIFFLFFFKALFPEQTKEAVLAGARGKQDGSPSNFLKHEDLDSGFQLSPVLGGFQD